MSKTTDDHTYYRRTGKTKFKLVEEAISMILPRSILDVGCNNGDMSYPFQRSDCRVKGVDLSKDLRLPKDYTFERMDITSYNFIEKFDCVMFLSLYHHLWGNHGLRVADEVFFKLLLSSGFLLFDTGNTSEVERKNTYWYKAQKSATEQRIINHFGIP